MLLDAHCEIVRPSLDACVLHPCWHMLTRMLKENEGQGADACLNISNYCELFGQIIRGVMCSQGCKTARHVNDTLIWFSLPRKHLQLAHQALLLSPRSLTFRSAVLHNMNWWVFKTLWHVSPMWHVNGIVRQSSSRVQPIRGKRMCFFPRLFVSRVELWASVVCCASEAGGEASRLILAARVLWGILSRHWRNSFSPFLSKYHTYETWSEALTSDTTKPSAEVTCCLFWRLWKRSNKVLFALGIFSYVQICEVWHCDC